MDDFDPCSPDFRPNELEWARQEFSRFYATASLQHTELMDSLVMVRVALNESMRAARALLSWSERMSLEKTCNENEQVFMYAREKLQRCATFQRLPLEEQTRIALMVFDVCAWPTDHRG